VGRRERRFWVRSRYSPTLARARRGGNSAAFRRSRVFVSTPDVATGYAELPTGQKTNLPRLSKPYRQAELQAEIDRLLERT
jgi:hypothetical protein